MKRLLFIVFALIPFSLVAQTVEIGANIGTINSLSVGISTWDWLRVGISYEANNPSYFPGSKHYPSNYSFYSPMIFLKPTLHISRKSFAYAAIRYGLFFDNIGDGCKSSVNDYILSMGGDTRLYKKWYFNGECGYLQINQQTPILYDNDYKSSRLYVAVGVRLLLNTHPVHKKL